MIETYLNKISHGNCLELFKDIPDNSVDITFADPPFNLKKKYNSHKDRLDIKDYLDWCDEWIGEMVRVTKPAGSIFLHNIPKWLTYYAASLNKLADFKHWISWDAPTAPMGKTLQPAHYGILYYAKDARHNKFYEIRQPHKRCRKCGYLYKEYVEISQSKLDQESSNSRIGEFWVSYFLDGIVTLRDKDWNGISQHYIIPDQIEQIDYIKIMLKGLEQSCICPPQGSKKSKAEESLSLPY